MEYNIIYCWEHCPGKTDLPAGLLKDDKVYKYSFFKKRGNLPCYSIEKSNKDAEASLKTSYFIGLDWIVENEFALYVAPKLNTKTSDENILIEDVAKDINEIDYVQMLFRCLKHPEVVSEVNELFEIKWDKQEIQIQQKHDLLTPILVVQFLMLLKSIVRKGLKKSYYRIEENLNAKVKGKVNVSKTIKVNVLKNKKLNTICSYEVFGLDNPENRLLNKTLRFIQRYLPSYGNITSGTFLNDTFNYISPAFVSVSDNVEINEIKTIRSNVFYREYDEAIRIAKIILQRFGYNISNIEKQTISTPPFWIDMSKLFELYVLGLLKDEFSNQVKYHFTHYGNELDFILKTDSYKMVIDAKYKLKYIDGKFDEDIRQVSGYARLKNVYRYLEKTYPDSIDCLIIYPDQDNGANSLTNLDLRSNVVPSYCGIYKFGVSLPKIK